MLPASSLDGGLGLRAQRPIFIIGTGSCGSSLVHSLVARHTDLAWYSNVERRLRSPLAGKLALRLLRVPAIAAVNWAVRPRGFVVPIETYAPLERAYSGFSEPPRDLRADDVTPAARRSLVRTLGSLESRIPGGRALLKWTGWSRVGFMNEIFPDSLFVHVHRDGRAVASSLIRQPWWRGNRGPTSWRWGPLPEELKKIWLDHGRSPAVLAGLQWKITFRRAETALSRIHADRVFRIAFERLLEEPVETVRVLHGWAGLRPLAGLEQLVSATPLDRGAIDRWRRSLSPSDARALQRALEDDLRFQDRLPLGAD